MRIQLPQQESEDSISLDAALTRRESKREYLDEALSLVNLSHLLFAGQGRRGSGGKLLAPSAQERYPLSIYVSANRVSDVPEGLYQYDNTDHGIVGVGLKNLSGQLEEAAIGEQPWVGNAAAVCILVASIKSMNRHFAEQPPQGMRGERYSYIEVGAVAQNMHLQGVVLNLGMVLVGGFDNDIVKSVLDLGPEQEPCALLCIGNV